MEAQWPVAPRNISRQDSALREKTILPPTGAPIEAASGRILLADDEELFARTTADLLRREGYECEVAFDAHAAAARLHSSRYDLLISDVRMPGNQQMELIRELPGIASGTQVILVTAYPSIQAAAQCVQMHVAAYLIKPLDFNELLRLVQNSLSVATFRRLVHESRRRLYEYFEQLRTFQGTLATMAPENSVPVDEYVTLTMNQVVGGLMDLYRLTATLTDREGAKPPCELLHCPRLNGLAAAMEDAVAVLEESKRAFESKELGELRKRLQGTLDALSAALRKQQNSTAG